MLLSGPGAPNACRAARLLRALRCGVLGRHPPTPRPGSRRPSPGRPAGARTRTHACAPVAPRRALHRRNGGAERSSSSRERTHVHVITCVWRVLTLARHVTQPDASPSPVPGGLQDYETEDGRAGLGDDDDGVGAGSADAAAAGASQPHHQQEAGAAGAGEASGRPGRWVGHVCRGRRRVGAVAAPPSKLAKWVCGPAGRAVCLPVWMATR